ncbi:MAG: hypothetical protein AAFX50_16420, partial [Acidobacteriota bacterium]
KLEVGLDFLRHQTPQRGQRSRGAAEKTPTADRFEEAAWAKDLERHSGVRMAGSSVAVEAIVRDPKVAARELEALGMTHIAAAGGLVSGLLPVSSLDRAEKVSGLRLLRPAAAPISQVGSTTSGGDAALGADLARSTFGVDGSGVKVGVLSDSFDWRAALLGDDSATQAGVAAGDLPGPGNPNGYGTPVQIVQEASVVETDEGRAMVEIVHDVAPGAEIGFATAGLSQASYAQNILALADPGGFDADILVDDILFKAEPFFQDGVVAQAVDAVVAGGKTYFAAAGNFASQSYESDFRPSPGPIAVGGPGGTQDYILHDFDPGPGVDYFQRVRLPFGEAVDIFLQWDDPFASSCAGCPGADTDVDLLLFLSPDPGALAARSDADNIDADPVEAFNFVNEDSFLFTFYIAIGKWTGAAGPNPNPGRIKWVDYENSSSASVEWATGSSTVVGHYNAEGTIAVGAAPYLSAGPGLVPTVQPYSSRGGTDILFAPDGTPTFDFRFKPDLVGPDGGNTSF